MAQIICDICGASDMIKQDGVFVCNVCGCKYSLEEVRKMLTGAAPASAPAAPSAAVASTPQTNTDSNSIINARKAVEREDFDEALRYYRTVKESDPNNVEAELYIAFCHAKSTMIQNNIFEREQKFGILNNTLGIIKDEFSDDDEKNRQLINMFSEVIFKINAASFVFNNSDLGYANNKDKTYALFETLHLTFIDILEDLNKQKRKDYIFEAIIKHCNFLKDSNISSINTLETMLDKVLRVEKEYKDYRFMTEDPEGYAAYIESKGCKLEEFVTYCQQKREAGALVDLGEYSKELSFEDAGVFVNNVFKNMAPGEMFVMGVCNGYPVVWIITRNDIYGDSNFNGKASIVSLNALFKMPHSTLKSCNWSNSLIRAHINTHDFINGILGENLRHIAVTQPTGEQITIPDADILTGLRTEHKTARLQGDMSGNNVWWWTKTPNMHRMQQIFKDVDPSGYLNAGHYADHTNIGVRIMVEFNVTNE